MKLEDCIPFGNAEDFEVDEIFDFIILFAFFPSNIDVKWKINALFVMYLKIHLMTGY